MSADENNKIKMLQTLEDITDCCICLETYTESRVLPCIHTFCLNCLDGAGAKTNRCAGDRMPCPICRKEFTIPEKGFSGLQKNFFMDRLVEIKKVLNPSDSVDRILCDLCSEDTEPAAELDIPTAAAFCADCRQKLCQDCCRHHKKNKLSKCHRIIDLKDQMNGDDCCIDSCSPRFCEQHIGKILEIYCSVCEEVVCAICFFETHKTHDGLHVSNVVDDFRGQILKNTEMFPKYVTDLVDGRTIAEKDMIAYNQKTEAIEIEINSAREELKHLVSKHSDSLLLQQRLLKHERLKQFEIHKDDVETLIASLESFETYCKQITVMGSASDICGAVRNLNKRAEELCHMYKAIKQNEMPFKDMSLRRAIILNSDDENIIGKIEENWTAAEVQSDSQPEFSRSIECHVSLDSVEECDETVYVTIAEDWKEIMQDASKEQLMEKTTKLERELEALKQKELERERGERGLRNYKATPFLLKTIPKTIASTGSVTVTGMTILESELFIATKKSNDIEVYDSTYYSFKRLLRVPQLNDPWDMCSCSRYKCLYIASGYNCSDDMRFEEKLELSLQQRPNNFYGEILKVNLLGSLQLSWYIDDSYGTVSVTSEGNVVLTVPIESKIVVYDTNGICLQVINLSTDYNMKVLGLYSGYIIRPTHAQKLPNCNFVVSYFIFGTYRPRSDHYAMSLSRQQQLSWFKPLSLTWESHDRCTCKNGLCFINPEGQMIKLFHEGRGPGFGQLHSPWYLAVDKNMGVIVLEKQNRRISLLNSSLVYMRKLISRKYGLFYPYRMFLDEKNGRILVTNIDSEKDHVLVYKIEEK